MKKNSIALKYLFLAYGLISLSIETNAQAELYYNWAFNPLEQPPFEGDVESKCIVADADGYIYITGSFQGEADFMLGEGTFILVSENNSKDIFIAKYNNAGNLIYAKGMGGSSDDCGNSLVVASGYVYLTGYFHNTVDFDPGGSASNLTSLGGTDAFLARYDPSGNYLFAKSMGGILDDTGTNVNLGTNITVTGYFQGIADFDPGVGSANLISNGGRDIFISAYNGIGNYVYSISIGGLYDDNVNDSYSDGYNTYITGSFQSEVDFDPSSNTVNLISSGNTDGFFAKYNVSGNYVIARRFGGSEADAGKSIAIDNSGNFILAGQFQGIANFNPLGAPALMTAAGSNDIFLAKFNSLGNYIYANRIGGSSDDVVKDIALDAYGHILITGGFSETVDFDPGVGAVNLVSVGDKDVFIAYYNTYGNYVFAKSMGSALFDSGNSLYPLSGGFYITGCFQETVDFNPGMPINNLTSDGGKDFFISIYDYTGNLGSAKSVRGISNERIISSYIDNFGNVYITGYFQGSVDFDPSNGATNLSSAGNYDVFIAKYDENGSFIYAKSIGGPGLDHGNSLTVDASGNVYVTGSFQGAVNFDPNVGTAILTSVGNSDVFIAKYDASGNYIYAKSVGGAGSDSGNSLAIDTSGNVYITGYFTGVVDFDPGTGATNLSSVGNLDVFIAKYDENGSFIYAKCIGGTGVDNSNSLTVDVSGNVYVTGDFQETVDFDPGSGTANLSSTGNDDIFIAKYDEIGNFLYAKSIGGTGDDHVKSLAIDATGNVYVTGFFQATVDFDPGVGVSNLTSAGSNDIFFAKYSASCSYVYAKSMGSASSDIGRSIVSDSIGNLYITGDYAGTVDFDPGSSVTNLVSIGINDVFLAKYDEQGSLVYAKSFGGLGAQTVGFSVSSNQIGDIIISGLFIGKSNFDPGFVIKELTSLGGQDIFLAKYHECSVDSVTNIQTACGSYTWIDGNTYTESNNTATYTLTNAAGCDSIITLNLTISHPLECGANNNAFGWAKAIGGTNSDEGRIVTSDNEGNIIVAGVFRNTVDFDSGSGNITITAEGDKDIFLMKLTSEGEYLWVKSFGGIGADEVWGMSLDANENIYLSGGFYNTVDFDPGLGTFNLTSTNYDDGYICKLDSDGNFIWAKSFGSTGFDRVTSMTINSSNEILVTGLFQGIVDFDPNAGTVSLSSSGSNDVFISKIDSSGNLVWAKNVGGTGSDAGYAITYNSVGEIYISGYFFGTADFDPGVSVSNVTSNGSGDIFILKLDALGNYIWMKQIGGSSAESIYSMKCDNNDQIIATGFFQGAVDFDPNSGENIGTSQGNYDIFLLKLNNNGEFMWNKSFGGTNQDWGFSVDIDVMNNVYITGHFESTVDFDPEISAHEITSTGLTDIFLLRLNETGNIDWIHTAGGISSDRGYSIAATKKGDVLLTGYFGNTVDFNQGTGETNLTAIGGTDIFVLKQVICKGTTSTVYASSCGSYTGPSGKMFLNSGHFIDTIQNISGCDSIISIHLDVIQPTEYTLTDTACESFTLNGETYTSSGIYEQHLTNAAGCDSTLTLNLTIAEPTTGTDVQSACASFTWIDGNTYTESNNTVTFTLTNAAGCDSTLTLNLTIAEPTTGTDVQTVCESFTWIDGNNYTESNNTATFTLTNTAGCDSVVRLNLTILQSTEKTITETACESFILNGATYTSSGIYEQHLTNAAGCDSALTLNLTIAEPTTGTDVQSACASFIWIDGNTYTESNNSATFILANAAGCDSVVRLNLTILQSTEKTITETACESFILNGATYTASGIYEQHLTNAAGCDSTIMLNLTITEPTSGIDVQTACGSFTWIDGNTYTESNNSATFILANAAGCDSVVTLNLSILQPTEKTITETACESFTLNGETYTSSGIYEQHLTNAAGCDSTLTLNLTIAEPTTGTDVQSACASFTWIDGNTYTLSNNSATFTLANTAGCDSIVTLNLTILQPTEKTITETACESFILNGETYATSGTYVEHLTNAAGCDSTLTLNLTIAEPTTGTDVQSACASFTWIDGNTYTLSNNSATFTLANTAGCDSIVTLNLTILQPTEKTITETACESFILNGETYTTSGIYEQHLTNAAGCDSTLTLNLTIAEPTSGTDMQTACGSFTWIDGNTYTESNNSATFILANAAGCDSVVTLNLTILRPTEKTITETACESLILNGETYTASGIYEQHLTNAAGCDSTLTLNLTITQPTTGTDVQTACGNFIWIDGNTYTESNNSATLTLANAAGCDSTLTLNLTIAEPTTGTDVQSACASFTWIDGNTYTLSNNTATFTLANAVGCDSVVTLNLTILQPTEKTITETACESFTLNGETYTTSGIYEQHLTNAAGCDSTLTLNLTIAEPTTGTDVQSACASFTWIDGNTYAESNNTATFMLANAAGCDSVVTLNLTILHPTEKIITETACVSFTLNGETYTTSGTYVQHLTNAAGCDSTLTLNLTITGSTNGTDVQTACASFTWIDGITYTESNNSATFVLTNAAGCDSIVTLNLTITNLDAAILQENKVLTASPSGAVYHWFDCINNNPIADATTQNFTPISSGQYAVIVEMENCTDTSECLDVTITSIEVNDLGAIKIYPNPVDDFLFIEGVEKVTTVEVYDVYGKKVMLLNVTDNEKPVIDMQALEQGVYFIKIYSPSGFNITTVMKN